MTRPIDAKAVTEKLMHEVMYDNGSVNRLEPEYFSLYWIGRIAPFAVYFFERNRDLLNDETLEEIACGGYGEVMEKYSHLDGFKELHNVIDEYFNAGGEEPEAIK